MLDSWSFHLSPSPSTSSSTRSSHLSVLTTASSVSSPPASPTGSTKTHAFFASPFSAGGGATPQPPPNPHKRTSSDEKSEVSAEDTPKLEHKVPARSLNADFFGPSLLPTPPPSIRSLSPSTSATGLRDKAIRSSGSRDTSKSPPSSRVALPPLSRFFPSRARYGSEPDSQSPSHGTNVRRDFVVLDTSAPHGHPDLYYAGQQTESPVDDDHPVDPPSAQQTPTPPPRGEESATVSTSSQRPPTPPPSDPEQPPANATLEPGLTLTSSSLSLELIKPLGTGTFSSVWLARDVQGQLNALELVRKSSLARSKSLRGPRSRTIDGTRPTRKKAKERAASESDAIIPPKSPLLSPKDEKPPKKEREKIGRLVAVKMTERAVCDSSSRSKVSFVREVEVLRHISHPSIVSYLHSFSTPSHYCLVLEHIGGGELLDLVDNAASHSRLDEPLVRRIWGELCRAVAWMHSVGLVHRDIKLENILLTTDPFRLPLPSHSLIKLTDFGLSRFIDPAHPHLTTLCGSDSYAAPELVMGRPYDGRETDAWACGVVLYALATRRLPFDSPTVDGFIPHEQLNHMEADWEVQRKKRTERKALLNRIAQGSYSWPDVDIETGSPLKGIALSKSRGIRRMVGHLLVRDPRRRAHVADLWIEEWMHEEGALSPPILLQEDDPFTSMDSVPVPPRAEEDVLPIIVNDVDGAEVAVEVDTDMDADVDEDDGVLVDSEDIRPGSVAHQEH